jgi:acetyl esterase/lipase
VPPITSAPTTDDEWRKLQRDEDAEATKISQAAAVFVGAKVEATKVAGVSCFRVTPKDVAAKNRNRLIVHVHGGAFAFNAGVAGTGEAVLLADACKMPALSIDYRMPPDHAFPAAADDALSVWKAIIAEHDPDKTAMAGTSAGAALTMTTMLRLNELNLARPAAVFLGTPAADLSKAGDTMYLNAEVDNALGRYEGRLEACAKLYAGGRDLNEPLLSPVYGDLSGFPPTILISGTRDLLLSDTVRTHRKLRSSGVEADLHVYEGMSHADYLVSFPGPEARDALGEIAKFFDRHLKY